MRAVCLLLYTRYYIAYDHRYSAKRNKDEILKDQVHRTTALNDLHTNDPNGSCLFVVGSPTDTVGSQNFQTFYTRQIAFLVAERPMSAMLLRLFGGGAADAGNATPTFCFSVPAISKLITLIVESLWTAPTETAKHHILAIDEAS